MFRRPLEPLVLLASGLAVAALAGCDVRATNAAGTPSGGMGSGLVAHAPQQPLIERIADAPFNVAYQGERGIELHVHDGDTPLTFVMRERVSADGHGRFAVDPLELIQPVLPEPDRDLFLIMQKVREGLMYRYRDFRVRNVALFFQNYTVHDAGWNVQVVGRTCAQLVVSRQDQTGLVYTVAVDTETGLVLRARAETQEQELVSLLEFHSLDLAPDLSNVAWHQSSNGETPFVVGPNAAAELGFHPRLPSLLPAGYEMEESTRVTDPTDNTTWLRMVYGDGVEEVFFLHGGPVRPPAVPGLGFPEADTVRVLECTPWMAAQGAVGGQRFVTLGKVDKHDLLALIESAAH